MNWSSFGNTLQTRAKDLTMLRKITPLALVLALGAFTYSAVTTNAAILQATPAISQATVFNHMDGSSCSFAAFGGAYAGPATLVGSASGNVSAQCNASLVAGSPVGSAIRVRGVPVGTVLGPVFCDIQYTRSGNANVSCHN